MVGAKCGQIPMLVGSISCTFHISPASYIFLFVAKLKGSDYPSNLDPNYQGLNPNELFGCILWAVMIEKQLVFHV